jgi:hypothetical protein
VAKRWAESCGKARPELGQTRTEHTGDELYRSLAIRDQGLENKVDTTDRRLEKTAERRVDN